MHPPESGVNALGANSAPRACGSTSRVDLAMTRIVHARIDAATAKVLDRLKRRLGWSYSRIIREATRCYKSLCRRVIVGSSGSGSSDRKSRISARTRGI